MIRALRILAALPSAASDAAAGVVLGAIVVAHLVPLSVAVGVVCGAGRLVDAWRGAP